MAALIVVLYWTNTRTTSHGFLFHLIDALFDVLLGSDPFSRVQPQRELSLKRRYRGGLVAVRLCDHRNRWPSGDTRCTVEQSSHHRTFRTSDAPSYHRALAQWLERQSRPIAFTSIPELVSAARIRAARSAAPGVSPCTQIVSTASGTTVPSIASTT